MKRILIIDYDFYNYSKTIKKIFTDKGWETELYTIKKTNTFRESLSIVAKSFFDFKRKEIMLTKRQKQEITNNVIDICNEYKPDAVLCIKGDYLLEDIKDYLKDITWVLWMMDSCTRYPHLTSNLSIFDRIYVFEKTDIEILYNLGYEAFFLPLGADERYYFPINSEKDIDILFVGALYRDRKKLFKKLINSFPDLKIEIYGNAIRKNDFLSYFWNYISGEYKIFRGLLKPEEINFLFSRSKICINMHHEQTKFGGNMRLYEILAANAFQVVDDNPYIEQEFNNCLVTFSNYEELCEIIKRYINDSETRKRISENGYKTVIKRDLLLNRIDIICDYLEK